MATQLKNIVLIGASGSVGSIILDALLASPEFNVTVLSRESSEATFSSGVTVRKTNFSESDLELVFKGQDAVVSAVGATGFGEQKKFVDAAVRAGVKRFIPSEFSANTLSDAVIKLLPLFGQKRDVIDYLKSKESEGLTWTGIGSALLFDWGLGNGILGYDIASRSATLWDGGHKKFTLINQKDLGDAVVGVLKHPQETANQYLYVSSVETSQKEILDSLEAETSSKWTVTDTSSDAQVSDGVKKLSAGDFSGALTLVRGTSYADIPGLRANYATDEKLANSLLGLKPESVKETVKRVVAKAA